MTDTYYYEIKRNKNINKNLLIRIIRCIQLKIFYYFVFTSLMFIFYWYLITCFCAVYENTQIAFIKDSLFSFLLDNLSSFVIYLFPSLFRIIAIRINKHKLECVYKLSNIIPLF